MANTVIFEWICLFPMDNIYYFGWMANINLYEFLTFIFCLLLKLKFDNNKIAKEYYNEI